MYRRRFFDDKFTYNFFLFKNIIFFSRVNMFFKIWKQYLLLIIKQIVRPIFPPKKAYLLYYFKKLPF